MTVTINEIEYIINRFNLSISKLIDDSDYKYHIEVDFANRYDFEEMSNTLIEDFNGSFIITTDVKTYTFTGYELEAIDLNVNSEYERFAFRAVKSF